MSKSIHPQEEAFVEAVNEQTDTSAFVHETAHRKEARVEATHVSPDLARVAADHNVSLHPDLVSQPCDCCGDYVDHLWVEYTGQWCDIHDVEVTDLDAYDTCPKCKLEQARAQEVAERMARRADPTMHNSVDAPANAIDHSRQMEDFM